METQNFSHSLSRYKNQRSATNTSYVLFYSDLTEPMKQSQKCKVMALIVFTRLPTITHSDCAVILRVALYVRDWFRRT